MTNLSRMMLFRPIIAACAIVASTWAVQAQQSPVQNYIVPTAPLGTNNNQAASTAFVLQNAGGLTCPAGQVVNGASCTATPTLGASGTLGSVTMGNATSGLLTLEPTTGALGSSTLYLPVPLTSPDTLLFQTEPSITSPLLTGTTYPYVMPNGSVAGMGTEPVQSVVQSSPSNLHASNAQYAFGVDNEPTGSGVNGPLTTDGAMFVIGAKKNFLTTSVYGETDGIFVAVRGGGPPVANVGLANESDVSAYTADARILTQSGSELLFEGTAYELTSSNTIVSSLDIQFGVINTTTAGSNPYGFVATATAGTMNTGLLIRANAGASITTAISTPGFTVDGSGNLSALTLAAPTFESNAAPTAAWGFDGTGSTVTIANGANAIIAAGSGLLLVRESVSDRQALYMVGTADAVLVNELGTVWTAPTTTPASGTLSIAFDGVSAYRIYNNEGASETVTVASLRSSTSF